MSITVIFLAKCFSKMLSRNEALFSTFVTEYFSSLVVVAH